jgi:mRNA-degrading endonuclease toxin of MazEF toxin-antitoxin module
MTSTTTYKRGQVVVVDVSFSDLSAAKRRPALIVSAEGVHRSLSDVVVCPISSQARYFGRPGPGDQPLQNWKSAGLRHPSTVRASKILAVDKKILGRTLGRLSDADLQRIDDTLRRTLDL